MEDTDDTFIKLEVDGSVLRNGHSGCGGVIRDYLNNWICGFCAKLTNVSPTIAELMGILHSLNLVWSRGHQKILIYSDSMEAINLATRGCEDSYPFKDLVDYVRLTVNRDWHTIFCHVERDLIPLADSLANYAHRIDGNFYLFDCPPPDVSETDGEQSRA
ncbi:uncharacterized protein LOC114747703 [Neltuma alba]|uniref:uncharacterized protein LOC114747703 n=1 Tax=Neltuma alba TaxID=207710 RepID=UPI0010A48012|nr:uncharacterized protein LOC114747703 [Prosopis alba]